MKLIPATLCAAACSILALSSAAAAPGHDSISSAVASVAGAFQEFRVDVDADGDEEAVLLPDAFCASDCAWRIVDRVGEGAYAVVAQGTADSVRLEIAAGAPGLVVADGVILAWNGRELYPYFDLLGRQETVPTTAKDMRAVRAAFGTPYLATAIQSWSIDLVGDAEAERVYVLTGDPANGMFRFMIASADGAKIHDGYSFDRPRLYFSETVDADVQVVSVTPAGLIIHAIR